MQHFDPLPLNSNSLFTVDVDERVERAHKLMCEKKVRHLVVTTEGKTIGILSDRDLMKALRLEITDFHSLKIRDESYNPKHKVRDIMSWPIICLDENRPLSEIIDLMLEKKISSMLLTRNGAVVDIVTTDDLLYLLKIHLSGVQNTTWGESIINNLYSTPIRTILETLANTGI